MLDILCAFLTMLAAAAFAQFGVTLKAKDEARAAGPEVHRTVHAQSRMTGSDPSVVRLQSPPVPQVGQKGG
jgi:hypothetical protein